MTGVDLQKRGISILVLEDDDNGFAMLERQLQDNPLEFQLSRVQNRQEFEAALQAAQPIDVILTEYQPADLGVLDAVEMVRERGLDIPTIIVSGQIGESEAFEALRQGASDYVPKDGLGKLVVAVIRALEGRRTRRSRQSKLQATAALRESERFARSTLDALSAHICILDEDGNIVAVNRSWREFGQRQGADDSRTNVGANYLQVCEVAKGEDAAIARIFANGIRQVLKGEAPVFELTYPCPTPEETLWFMGRVTPFPGEGPRHVVVTHENITEQEAARRSEERLRIFAEALADNASAVNSTLDLNEILGRMLDNVRQVIPYDAATVLLIDGDIARPIEQRGYAELGSDGILSTVKMRVESTSTLRVMATTRRPLIVSDTAKDGEWVIFDGLEWLRSVLGAPITVGDEVIGFINLDATTPDHFKPFQKEQLQAFADQAAIAIQNSQQYAILKRRSDEVNTLRQITLEMTRQLDLDKLLHLLVSRAIELLEAESGGIYFYLPDEDVLEWRVQAGATSIPIGARIRRGEGLSGKVWESGEAALIFNYQQWEEQVGTFNNVGVEAVVAAPILWGSELLGVINAAIHDKSSRTFSERDKELLRMFADQAAVAIQNARLFEELEGQKETLEQIVQERTREVRRSRNHLEAIVNSTGEAVIVFDRTGRVLNTNPALEQILGYSRQELMASNFRELLPPETDEQVVKNAVRQVAAGKVWRGEMAFTTRDGATFDAALTVTPLLTEAERQSGFVCVMRDVTPLKEVARMKDAFVTNVSHELRTPITGLKLYHGLLKANRPGTERYLATMEREIDRLAILIEDLLQLSRLDQDRIAIKLGPVAVNEVASTITEDREFVAQDKSIRLTLDLEKDLPMVRADAGLLGRALSLILTNALTYTPSGGRVVVGSKLAEVAKRHWVQLSVTDSGPGILPEEQAQLFERFFRGRVGRESGTPGTGMGLSIAHEIVSRLGGRITVESSGQAGEGARFVVWLQVNPR